MHVHINQKENAQQILHLKHTIHILSHTDALLKKENRLLENKREKSKKIQEHVKQNSVALTFIKEWIRFLLHQKKPIYLTELHRTGREIQIKGKSSSQEDMVLFLKELLTVVRIRPMDIELTSEEGSFSEVGFTVIYFL